MGGSAGRRDAGQPPAGASGHPVPVGTALGGKETVHDRSGARRPWGAGTDPAGSQSLLGGILLTGGDFRDPDLRGHCDRRPDTSVGSGLAPHPPPLGRGRQALASCPEQSGGQRRGGGGGGPPPFFGSPFAPGSDGPGVCPSRRRRRESLWFAGGGSS